jgi:hypothetical protein
VPSQSRGRSSAVQWQSQSCSTNSRATEKKTLPGNTTTHLRRGIFCTSQLSCHPSRQSCSCSCSAQRCSCSTAHDPLATALVGCDQRSAGTPWSRVKILVCRRSLRELVTPYVASSQSCSCSAQRCSCSPTHDPFATALVGCDQRSAGTPWSRVKILVCRRSLRELVTPYIAGSQSCSCSAQRCSYSPTHDPFATALVGCDQHSAGTPSPRVKILVCRRSLRELVTPYVASCQSCSCSCSAQRCSYS